MAIFEQIKVNKETVALVSTAIKEARFYKMTKQLQEETLRKLTADICEVYGIEAPEFTIDTGAFNHYRPTAKGMIVCESASIISMLHELRHHLQHQGGKRYRGMTIEQDARAWSLRVFSLAAPGSFKRSVKAGQVLHIKWDEATGKIVDDAKYI